MSNQEFEYGWCHTDHKDGKKIRGGRWRKTDYMQDEPTRAFVEKTLLNYGLPLPDIQHEVFRGTNHDLLFLNSHGIVIRIGITNVEELVNPAILQPLHWVDDDESGITVALYPGIEILDETAPEETYLTSEHGMQSAILLFGNSILDANNSNAGYIKVNDSNQQALLPILLDADSDMQKRRSDKPSLKPSEEDHIHSNMNTGHSKAITDVYNEGRKEFDKTFNTGLYLQAFEYHQPLRRAFARAFKQGAPDGTPNKKAIAQAWEMAKNFHTKGYQIWRKPKAHENDVIESPVTEIIRVKMGFNKPSPPKETRTEARQCVETRQLHSPWVLHSALTLGKIDIESIPKDKLTKQNCLNRLHYLSKTQRESTNLEFELIPKDVLDAEICAKVIDASYFPHLLLESIPETLKTHSFWLHFTTKTPEALRFIPEENHSPELYEIALKKDPDNIVYCRADLLTEELCFEVVIADETLIEYLPDHLTSPRIWEAVFQQNALLLCHFPEHEITPERLKQACDKGYVPENLPENIEISKNLWAKSLAKNIDVFRSLPEEYKTDTDFIRAYAREVGEQDHDEINDLHEVLVKKMSPSDVWGFLEDNLIPDPFLEHCVKINPRAVACMHYKPERAYLYEIAHECMPSAIAPIPKEHLPQKLRQMRETVRTRVTPLTNLNFTP